MRVRLRRLASSPGFTLFLLAPAIGELLSSSMPPKEYFSIFGLTCIHILYGGGAVIVRELTFRWRKGWGTLLVLGAAYGILEEGLLCKSFFDPNWPDLGDLAHYGRWLGVNWIWSLELTAYHACVSIATSILLVSLIFPNRRAEPWAAPGVLKVLIGLLALDTLLGVAAFGSIKDKPYHPPIVPYIMAIAVMVGLYFVAKRLPHPLLKPVEHRVRRPRLFWLIGFGSMLAFFRVPAALQKWHTPAAVTFTVVACMFGLILWLVLWLSGNGAAWNDLHRFALVAGPLSFFILFGSLRELGNAKQPDDPAGMVVVAAAAVIMLVWLARRLLRKERKAISGSVPGIPTL